MSLKAEAAHRRIVGPKSIRRLSLAPWRYVLEQILPPQPSRTYRCLLWGRRSFLLSESEDLSQRTDNDESLGGEACGNWYGKPNTSLMLCHWKGKVMSVLKVIEIMGDSEKGWEAAAGEAITEAAKTVKNIRSIWIKDHAATVEGGKIKRYRVTCKITFEVESQSRRKSR